MRAHPPWAARSRQEHALRGAGGGRLAAAVRRAYPLSPADGLVQPLARPISLKNDSIEIIRRLAPTGRSGRLPLTHTRARWRTCDRPPRAAAATPSLPAHAGS